MVSMHACVRAARREVQLAGRGGGNEGGRVEGPLDGRERVDSSTPGLHPGPPHQPPHIQYITRASTACVRACAAPRAAIARAPAWTGPWPRASGPLDAPPSSFVWEPIRVTRWRVRLARGGMTPTVGMLWGGEPAAVLLTLCHTVDVHTLHTQALAVDCSASTAVVVAVVVTGRLVW